MGRAKKNVSGEMGDHSRILKILDSNLEFPTAV